MGITERRLREKEKVRTAILSTAWEMVKEEGWQSLSIRKIADSIEYSVPVIYDYFENKEAILFEFGKEGFKKLAQKIEAAKEETDDPAEQLKIIAHAYWDFASRNKEYYQLMYGMGMTGCEIEKCLPEKTSFRTLVNEPISRLIKKGKSKDADSCLKYYTFWSILHGLISLKNMRGSAVSDEINKLVMEDAVDGFIKNLG
ncbi:MAG: TetR/AcrR family transcriptional regulator [Sphingobacteriales bacterium]|nr:MAG: TetR/AcrR family transcriptional regulator [Sphingobacteriales bacterium]